MGGMIGQTLALKSPELFLSLSLCDTSSRIPAEAKPLWADRIKTAQSQGMEPLVEGTISRWFTAPFREQHKDVVDPVRTMIRRTPPQGYAGCCAAISALDLTDRLPAIKLPTLIVVGEEDQGTPVAASQAIQAKIAGSQLRDPKVGRPPGEHGAAGGLHEGADLVPGASQLTPVAAPPAPGAGVDGASVADTGSRGAVMRWTSGRQSDDVEDQRGSRVPLVAGGGIGSIVLVLLALYFGVDPSVVLQGQPAQQTQQAPAASSRGSDEIRDFVSVVLADTEDTWRELFRRMNREYIDPKLVLFSGAVAVRLRLRPQPAVGPFYCPADQQGLPRPRVLRGAAASASARPATSPRPT